MEAGASSLEITKTKEDNLSIQIVNDEDLASSIKGKMRSIALSHCICRVPENLFNGNKEKYHPSLVSIGPLHHGRMKGMEDHKWRYFNTLLSREPNAEGIVDRCITALRHAEQKARNFYCETVDMASDQFVEMMLIDGCFIIELFLEQEFKSLRRGDDPIFSTDDKVFHLTRDLILLENQLPFFILEHLFHFVPIPKKCTVSLTELALCFFRKLIPGAHPLQFGPEIHHLLDLIRLHYLPVHPPTLLPTTAPSHKPVHRATRLHTFGIKLQKATVGRPLDIAFVNGELRIPPLKIHSYTEILLGNFVAMEHCHPECSKAVTSYAIFMGQLIKTKRDVSLLLDNNILTDGYDREGEMWLLFKKLHVDINADDFYYRGVCEEVNDYKPRKRRVFWEKIRHIYHRTRMGIAGLSLAVLLLVFLFTGAFFSALTFLLHHFQ